MFSLKKVYLVANVTLHHTSVLVAEHNNERISVLGVEKFSNEGTIRLVEPNKGTELFIAKLNGFSYLLKQAISGLEKRIGVKLTGFVLVLPSGNFQVTKDLRDRVFALNNGSIVTANDIEKAIEAKTDHKDAMTCHTVPYGFSLDDVSYQSAPINKMGTSLVVLRAHYVMDQFKAASFFNLAAGCGRDLMGILPAELATLHECCDYESLRNGVVGICIQNQQSTINQVRLGFESELFAPFSFGKESVLAEVAEKLGIETACAAAYATNIDLYSSSNSAVVRTFEQHYSRIEDITVSQVAAALRAALSKLLAGLKTALSARKFGTVFPSTLCFTGHFAELPGFKRLVEQVMGSHVRVIVHQPTVIGAKKAELNAALGAVRILAAHNAMVENKEYAMQPYQSAELQKGNVRKYRFLSASRMVSKALEGVLGNK